MQTDRQQKGAVAEAAVVKRLVELGYTVSMPQSPARYDLIVDDGESLIRVQVKSMRVNDGRYVEASLESRRGSTSGQGAVSSQYSGDEIDAFALYNAFDDEVYWLDVEDAPNTRVKRTYESWQDSRI